MPHVLEAGAEADLHAALEGVAGHLTCLVGRRDYEVALRRIAALRPKSEAVSFGYYAIQTLQKQMQEYEHTGTVFGSINSKQLALLPLARPTADVIHEFEVLVHPWDEMIRLRTEECRILADLRDALLPMLMSGAICARCGGVMELIA